MSTFSLVLSDELLKCYTDLASGKAPDRLLVQNLFRYYPGSHLSTVTQLRQAGNEDDSLHAQLAGMGYISQNSEELCKSTLYQIILNTEKSEYPYVNINKDSLERNFSFTFKKNEAKNKVVNFLNGLCGDAKQVWIFDKYLEDEWKESQEFFKKILPQKELKINLCTYLKKGNSTNLPQDKKKQLKDICNAWTIVEDKNTYDSKSHDRYLMIQKDGGRKIEINFSSGFAALFDINSDISILIREL